MTAQHFMHCLWELLSSPVPKAIILVSRVQAPTSLFLTHFYKNGPTVKLHHAKELQTHL